MATISNANKPHHLTKDVFLCVHVVSDHVKQFGNLHMNIINTEILVHSQWFMRQNRQMFKSMLLNDAELLPKPNNKILKTLEDTEYKKLNNNFSNITDTSILISPFNF